MSRRVEKVEQEVRQSRERLSGTLDELRSRMQPSSLRREASQHLADTAPARFLTNLKADVLGKPMPLALLGVAVAWLASADRSTQQSASLGSYITAWRWRARRLTQAAQQNASKVVGTVQATGSAAGELQHRASAASNHVVEQLSRAPAQVRDLGQSVVKSTTVRANAVADVARTQPIIVGAAAAGIVASAVALTLLYRRYAEELDAASSLVQASEQETEAETMALLREAHATLVPQTQEDVFATRIASRP